MIGYRPKDCGVSCVGARVRISAFMHLCVYVCMRVCVCVCVYLCVCLCVCVLTSAQPGVL